MEVIHGDFGPIFDTKEQAEAARDMLGVDDPDYEVVALDKEGYPIG